jgi:hypothetical protein
MKIEVILLVLVFSGCATLTNYDGVIESYHGITEAELIRTWGIPAQIHRSKNSRLLTYSQSSAVMFGLMRVSSTCQTTFEIQDRKVISSSFEGKKCRGWGKDRYDPKGKKFILLD